MIIVSDESTRYKHAPHPFPQEDFRNAVAQKKFSQHQTEFQRLLDYAGDQKASILF